MTYLSFFWWEFRVGLSAQPSVSDWLQNVSLAIWSLIGPPVVYLPLGTTPRGIQNLNNICFANSVLQALLSVERFSKGLESIQHNREKCSAKKAGKKYTTHPTPAIVASPRFKALSLKF